MQKAKRHVIPGGAAVIRTLLILFVCGGFAFGQFGVAADEESSVGLREHLLEQMQQILDKTGSDSEEMQLAMMQTQIQPGEEIPQAKTKGENPGEDLAEPSAVELPAGPPSGEILSEMAAPGSDGVSESLMFKGEVNDFLKMLSVSYRRNIITSPAVRGRISVTLFDFTLKEALDAVLPINGYVYEENGPYITVYTTGEYDKLRTAERKTEMRTFHLNYVPAKDVQEMILPLVSTEGSITTSPEVADGGPADSWAGSNCLIVRDYPENIEQIAVIVKELDVRPLQVLVEATILVASLKDKNELGIDFSMLAGVDFQAANGSVGTIPEGSVSLSGTSSSMGTGFSNSVTGGGLSIGVVKSNIGLFIEALESTTDVVTLGNPKVLTLNRQEGKVIVGNRDGYVTTESTQTATIQKIEFLETGTQLTFRPFVMDSDYIRMELNPKDSGGGVEVTGNFTLPSEQTAEVETNILVRDGETIVIGGLFRDKTNITHSQVPVLGSIPGLGALFRSTSDDVSKEEVIFLITPRILREPAAYAMGREAREQVKRISLGMREGLMRTGRDRLAAMHYQQARQLQQQGNYEKALQKVQFATQISPAFLDAHRLYDELSDRELIEGQTGTMERFLENLIEKENQLYPSQSRNVVYLAVPGSDFGANQPMQIAESSGLVSPGDSGQEKEALEWMQWLFSEDEDRGGGGAD